MIIEVSAGLQSIILVSVRKSRIYFFWDIKMPLFYLSTSIPRKYLRFPRSFISNSLNNLLFNCLISSSSSPVIIISSTYMIRQVTLVPLLLINKVSSALLCLYLNFFIAIVNLPNQARGDCFNPYKAFFNLHPSPLLKPYENPGGASI